MQTKIEKMNTDNFKHSKSTTGSKRYVTKKPYIMKFYKQLIAPIVHNHEAIWNTV